MSEYSPDTPITRSSDDSYNRDKFAAKLAELLSDKSLTENYVLGLYSPWGYGKTSVLKLTKQHLSDRATVIEFNPWIYEDRQTIIASLLTDVAGKLGDKYSDKNYIQKKYAQFTNHGLDTKKDSALKLIKLYSGLISTGTSIATANAGTGKLIDKVTQLTQQKVKGSSLTDLKRKIENLIKLSGKRIIVFIDDVDRLDKNEIFELFKLIKIIADFRGITYVVACDDEAVASSLNKRFASSNKDNAGYDFLEKIIQVPLHLPMIDREIMEEDLFQGVFETLQENKFTIDDDSVQTFRSIYRDQLRNVFKTPRSVKRYLNSIKFTMPLIANEVDPVDFLLLEVFRVFYPTVYSKMRHEKELLTGTKYHLFIKSDNDDAAVQNDVLELTKKHEASTKLVRTLFPSIEKAFNSSRTIPDRKELRLNRFVASPDYFDRYFSYGIPINDVSDTEIIEMLQPEETSRLIYNLDQEIKKHGASKVLKKVSDYSLKTNNPLSLISALLHLGGKLDESKVSVYSASEVEESVDIIVNIIKDSNVRMPTVRLVLSECKDNEQLFYIIRNIYLGSTDKSNENILSETELIEFKQKVVMKIREQASSGKLHKVNGRGGHYLYDYWAEFGDRTEVNKYLRSSLKNYKDVIDFITLYLPKWTSEKGTFRGNFDDATLKYINKSVDVEYLAEIILKKYPKAGASYPELEHSDDGIGKAGNEQTKEFRDLLKDQFISIYNRNKAELEDAKLSEKEMGNTEI